MLRHIYPKADPLVGDYPEALFYFKRHLLLSSDPKANACSSTTTQSSNFRSKLKKIVVLISLLPEVLRLFALPRGRVFLFNSTTRVRRGPQGTTSLYAERLGIELPGLVILDARKTVTRYPVSCVVRSMEGVESILGAIARRDLNKDINLALFLWRVRFWSLLFKVVKPSSIALVVWYGKEWVVAAAKRAGVKVVELQHGVIQEENRSYDVIEGRLHPGSEFLLPDQCLVYGQYWKERLIALGWAPERVSVLGYFQDCSIKSAEKVPFRFILYVSQPGYQRDIVKHIESCLDRLRELGLKIVIAPHPSSVAEDLNHYSHLLGDSVSIRQEDSYDLLAQCTVCVAALSSLLWEGAYIGKRSYILKGDMPSPRFLDDLLACGFFKPLHFGEVPVPFEPMSSAEVKYFMADLRQDVLNDLGTPKGQGINL